METKELKSTNATASAFGWDFQCNSAIMLMLKNMRRASCVNVEGEIEDIEIQLENGNTIMAQAKSVCKSDDYTNTISKLTASLGTLNKASHQVNVEELVYITNSPNPFNEKETMYKFSSPYNRVPFSSLPATCKTIIETIYEEKCFDFDKETFSVHVLQFEGDGEERYKVLTQETREFLNSLGVQTIPTDSILGFWQQQFCHNASQRSCKISKQKMVWPIISILCDIGNNNTILSDCDQCEIDEITRKYHALISNKCESFPFITKVLSIYNDFGISLKSNERTQKFINQKWNSFFNEFDLNDISTEIREKVIKLIIANVIRNRNEIKRIKGKTNIS